MTFGLFFFNLEVLSSFCAHFKAFMTPLFFGKFGAFHHLFTFGATFWYFEIKFSRNGCKKRDKNAKKFEKVSGPGLYK